MQDLPSKTVVLVGIGTTMIQHQRFYIDGKQETIEWKPNRLMIFCGETGVTWHDYKSSDETRYTYNYFLVDPTRIENEAYKDHCIRV